MDMTTELEKLADLKEKGVITDAEFEMQKKLLLEHAEQLANSDQKSASIYALLGLLFGGLGIHNFYAGYWKRAFSQLILSFLGVFTSGIINFGVYIWILVEIFRVRKDAKGVPMKPMSGGCLVAIILFILLPIIGILSIGGIAGYTISMHRYRANEVIDYIAQCATHADGNLMTSCETLTQKPLPEQLYTAQANEDGGNRTVIVAYAQQDEASLNAIKSIIGKNPSIIVNPNATVFTFTR